jgi:hypothetical protein
VKVPPAITASFDFAASAALFFARPKSSQDSHRVGAHLSANAVTVIAAASIVGILLQGLVAKKRAGEDIAVANPASWVNTRFPLLSNIDDATRLSRGRWLLFFYHYDCQECLDAIPTYRQLAQETSHTLGDARIAFVAVPPFAPSEHDPIPPSLNYDRFVLRQDHPRIATTPLTVSLQDGRVLAASVISAVQ